MGWEEKVFKKTWHVFSRKKSRERKKQEDLNAVKLTDVKDKLTIFARALSGHKLFLEPARREGGYNGVTLFLPGTFSHYQDRETNLSFYTYRVIYLCAQRELGLNCSASDSRTPDENQAKAIDTAPRVLEKVYADYPDYAQNIRALIEGENPPEAGWLYGHWIAPSSAPEANMGTADENPEENENPHPDSTTQLEGQTIEEAEIIDKDSEKISDYTLTHNFEKVETLEEFGGQWRDLDGDDDLEEHKEALDKLDLRKLIRTSDPTHSIYQAAMSFPASVPDSKKKRKRPGLVFSYPEWDRKKNAYRQEHCHLYPRGLTRTDPDFAGQLLRREQKTLIAMRRVLSRFLNRPRTQPRQMQGEMPDPEAMVARFADLRAGCAPDERLYLQKRNQEIDLSLLILTDQSLSTDGYVGNVHILDTEKTAMVLFGELLSEAGINFQMDSFYSQSRNEVVYTHIKTFDEPWTEGKNKIGAIQPYGFTRIGAALRHASNILNQKQARSKWILLLSDGKPNDCDRYEGNHGMDDTRKAIRELKAKNTSVYTLAIDDTARFYLPQMLGRENFQILSRPQRLPMALLDFLLKIERFR